MQQTGVADPSGRNTTMRVFKLPAFVRVQLYGATKPRAAPAVRLRRRRRYGRHQQPPATVRLWLAAGTFLLRFRQKEREMPSLQPGPGSRSIFRLMSCAAAALLTSGTLVADWFLRRRDYRRTLGELRRLSEPDLRELRISAADFSAIAWAEAERLHELRSGSQLSNGSLGGRLRSPSEHSRPTN
jgi:hypothetical protein